MKPEFHSRHRGCQFDCEDVRSHDDDDDAHGYARDNVHDSDRDYVHDYDHE